ncbi:DUF4438 domain-containing protein [Acidobacteriota bacterium]
MKKNLFITLAVLLCLAVGMAQLLAAAVEEKPITTNKDKLLTIAVQGTIAPAEPSRSYATTWDGKPKMAIGIGGINFNLTIGKKIFGWANGDRATMGVATVGAGEDRFAAGWTNFTSIGNEVKVLSGEAKGQRGIIIGKFSNYVLVHFESKVMEKLSIGEKFQSKVTGTGLEILGFPDVFPHGIAPEVLEKLAVETSDGKIEVPVVKEIPGEIVGQGAGRGSLSGNWHIQTCFPPDIEKYGLEELRFGDLVLLKDIQTDYGMGYYKGGATLGVVCSGPSDISGLGIGVTPVLSTRFGKIVARIEQDANIAKYIGIKIKKVDAQNKKGSLPTNKASLITTAVQAVVQPPGSRGYSTTYDGKPKVSIGMASINYTVSVGDTAFGWASADHVEPDVTIQGRDRERAGECAVAILGCIGNEATVLSGDAAGAKGVYLGRHAGSDDLAWFPPHAVEKLALYDKIQIKSRGVGLRIDGFDDVRVNKISPEVLEKLGISIDGDQLIVPVVMEVPGHIMGSGIGGNFIESVDYDIQTTDPSIVEKYNLKDIKLGDLIAIVDHYDYYGRGRYKGAVTIGVCIHGWSDYAGHGPGLNPILSALPGKIKTKIDHNSNIVYALGLRTKPRQ